MKRAKVRVNITVDKETLEKAKSKLHLFGGKLSTLFNAYLHEFVDSIDKEFSQERKVLQEQMKELEKRLKRVEELVKR